MAWSKEEQAEWDWGGNVRRRVVDFVARLCLVFVNAAPMVLVRATLQLGARFLRRRLTGDGRISSSSSSLCAPTAAPLKKSTNISSTASACTEVTSGTVTLVSLDAARTGPDSVREETECWRRHVDHPQTVRRLRVSAPRTASFRFLVNFTVLVLT